jgi:hypothetical protein
MSRNTSAPVAFVKVEKPTVLVWQSYGTVRVHPADTVGDLCAILAEVSNTVGGWDLGSDLDELASRVTYFVEKQNLERARREITSFCARHSDHESFETFEFCKIEELS